MDSQSPRFPGPSNAESSLSLGAANSEASLSLNKQKTDSNSSVPPFEEQVKSKIDAAHNLKYKDPTLQVYEALAIAEERNQEIERLRREIEELRRHMQGIQGSSNAESSLSLGPANSSPSPSLNQQNTHSNLSGEDKVNIAINAITQAVVELRNTVRGLAERVEETADNFRIFQRRLEGKVNEVSRDVNEKMDRMDNIQDTMDSETTTRFNELQNKLEELEDRGNRKERDCKEIEERIGKEIQERIASIDKRVEERINKMVEERIGSINKNMEGKIGPMRHSTAVLSNSQIVLLGGVDGNQQISKDIFQLDYATKKWKILPIKMPYAVADHGCVMVNDELYIIGGGAGSIAKSSVQQLNKYLKWEKRKDMNETRYGIQNSCVVYDNCIWVFGGGRDENGTFIVLNTVEKYDPKTDKWEKKPEMKTKRGYSAAAVIKDKIYVCGGYDGTRSLDSVEVFDTTSEVWTDFCTMPEPRCGLCVVVEGTSIILIGGLFKGKEQKTVWKMDVEEKEKKWTDLPPPNQARAYSSAVKIEGGYILVTGGYNGSPDETLNSVEIFDGQKWNEFSSLPEERDSHTTCLLTPPMIDAFKKFLI